MRWGLPLVKGFQLLDELLLYAVRWETETFAFKLECLYREEIKRDAAKNVSCVRECFRQDLDDFALRFDFRWNANLFLVTNHFETQDGQGVIAASDNAVGGDSSFRVTFGCVGDRHKGLNPSPHGRRFTNVQLGGTL